MKYSRRINRIKQDNNVIEEYYCDDYESQRVKKETEKAWEIREDAQKKEAARIEREIECVWAEFELIEKQTEQMWKTREDAQAARIEREIECAWAEFELSKDIIDVDELFENEDDLNEFEEQEIYQKNKKRASRRKATKRAKKRLIIKSKHAERNLLKRCDEDLKNFEYHFSEGLKLRIDRYIALKKRVNRLQY